MMSGWGYVCAILSCNDSHVPRQCAHMISKCVPCRWLQLQARGSARGALTTRALAAIPLIPRLASTWLPTCASHKQDQSAHMMRERLPGMDCNCGPEAVRREPPPLGPCGPCTGTCGCQVPCCPPAHHTNRIKVCARSGSVSFAGAAAADHEQCARSIHQSSRGGLPWYLTGPAIKFSAALTIATMNAFHRTPVLSS